MAKRKCEQSLVAVLPPCKRPLCEPPVYSRHCTPRTLLGSPKRKRKMEPEFTPSPECAPLPHTDGAAAPHPPSKKLKPSESQDTKAAPAFQCQKDDAFPEYNSFHFWRTPLPDIDFSELAHGACDGDRHAVSTGTEVLEEMDS